MELLTKLYYISSKSGDEVNMVNFIKDYIEKHNPEAFVTEDESHNLYVTQGEGPEYPCIVAHMDEVHKKNPNKVILTYDNNIFGYDPINHCNTGIGADDKNGIWICLKALATFQSIKCAFFVGEETGCNGSNKANMDFFKDCLYVLQCDRKDNCDFITSASGTELCNDEFVKAIGIEKFGYKKASGMMTDVRALKNKGLDVCACNISCGYYHPHTDDECTYFPDLEKCWKLVKHIVLTISTKQTFIAPKRSTYSYYGTYNNYSGYYSGNKSNKESKNKNKESEYVSLFDDYEDEDDYDFQLESLREFLTKFYQLNAVPAGRLWSSIRTTFPLLRYTEFLKEYRKHYKK